MRKNIIIAAIAAASAVLLTVSCAKQEQPGLSNEGKTFTAVIDQGITKTTIDAYNVKWVSGDEISINGAVYSATPDGIDATKAGFAYKSGTTPSSPYSAIYPASLYNAGSLEFPAVQTHEDGKFNAPMYAKSTTESLSFKNICGVICFGLKGTSKVKSIAITANEAICGAFTMLPDATTVSLTGTGKTVKLDCGAGVQLETEFTKFYVYLPPQNYTAGMKIVITDTDGGTFTQSTISDVVIKRNQLYTLNWTPSFIPAGALAGKFSVSATKQVQFSKGNLYWDGSAFKFEANQYDTTPASDGSCSSDHISHFYWSKTASVAYYGGYYSDSDAKVSDVFFTNATVDTPKADFTVNGVTGQYRTLSKGEWQYLFNNHSYKWASVNGVNGYVIAPDGFAGTLSDTYADDAALATAGNLVFLPVAGYRNNSSVYNVGDFGSYWSSTAHAENSSNAWRVYINSASVSTGLDDSRSRGHSVRLITDCQ